MSTEYRKIDNQIDPDIVTDPNTRKVTMYCINTCSTCKQARKALEDAGVVVHWRDLRAQSMGFSDWEYLESQVGWDALVNRKSQTWRNLDDADKEALDRDTALELLVKKPTLMKRPAIDLGDKVILGWNDEAKSEFGLS